MVLAAATVCALVAFSPTTNADEKAPIKRVYVFTAEGTNGQPTDEEKDREDATREVRDALAKRKEVQVVDNREDADVIVEVMEREERQGPEGGFGGKTVTKMGDMFIRARVSHAAGGEPSELKGIGQGTWGRAAKDLADRIVKWVQRDQPTPHKRGNDRPPSTLMTLPVA
jgi:hypothetical protein